VRALSFLSMTLFLVLLAALGCRERSGALRVVLSDGLGAPAVDGAPVPTLARRASALRRLRQDGGAPLLVLEAGGWTEPGPGEAGRRRDRLHAQLLGQLHTDVVVLGTREAALPAADLLEVLRDAGPRWLAGAWREARSPWGVDTAYVVERGGLVAAVLDHVEPSDAAGAASHRLSGALARRAAALRPWVDLVVVVAEVPSRREDSLATELAGLADLVLLADSGGQPWHRQVGSLTLASLGGGGGRLGIWEVQVEKGRRVRGEWSLVDVDMEPSADPAVVERLAALEETERALQRGRREALRQQTLARLGLRGEDMPGEEAAARYEGARNCAACHGEAWEAWRTSAHAEAWTALEREKATADPPRVRRATTGWLEKGGWVNHRETPELSGVGCEACHGRGSSHVYTRGESFKDMETDPAAACARCHETVPEVDPHSLRPR
jgi:hypothetical protein